MAVIYSNALVAGTEEQAPDSTPSGWQTGLTFLPLQDGGFLAIWADEDQWVAGQIWGRRYDSAGRPVAEEFEIGAPGPDSRSAPSVAPLASGGFIVTWTAEDASAGNSYIAAQIFGSDGQRIGDEFKVVASVGEESRSTVVGLEGGGFVVLCHDYDGYGAGSWHAQVFDSGGVGIGDPFVVGYSDDLVAVAALAGGGFVIVSELGQERGYELNAEIYDSAGILIGEMLVDGTRTGIRKSAAVAGLPSGGYVVAWSEDDQLSGSDVFQVKARMFESDGRTFSAQFAVSPHGANHQHTPSIAVGGDGGFAIGWMEYVPGAGGPQNIEYVPGAGGAEIRAQRFDPSGTPIGDVIPVNLAVAGDQYLPEVAMLAGGAMVVGWRQGQPSGLDDVMMRVFFPAQSGTAGDDVIAGGDGRDFIDGGEGNDRISGGPEQDGLFGGEGNDRISGGPEQDGLSGGEGDDVLDGGEGNDVLYLQGGGEDSAIGGAGGDVIYFGTALSAGDVADGGDGRDAIVLQGNVTAVLSETNLVGIESISIQSGANGFFGDTADNFYDTHLTTVDGNVGAGQQLIVNAQSLRAGEDFTFDGSAETDGRFVVYGGHGVDILTGGDGVDVFFFEGQRWGPDDRVDGGAGRDALVISAGDGGNYFEFGADSFTGIESISLNSYFASDPTQRPSYDLVLHNGNVAPGGTLIVNGNSLMVGQWLHIDGRAVEDGKLMLFGGAGSGSLNGGSGDDLIFGGGSADGILGGPGADTFRYDEISDSTAEAPDYFADFETGSDRIDLGRIDANTVADGDQAFTWIGSARFSGVPGQLRVFLDAHYQKIEGDTNGDGNADLVIFLRLETPLLVPADFLL